MNVEVRRGHTRKKGSVLVESTITLPLFFALLAAIVQFGYAYAVYLTIQNASVVAARAATLSTGKTTSEVCALARAAVSSLVDSNQLVCATDPATLPAAADTAVTINLSYTIPLLLSSNVIQLQPNWTLEAHTVMQ